MKFLLLIGMIAAGFLALFSLLEGAVFDLIGAFCLLFALLILSFRNGLPSRHEAIGSTILIAVFLSTQLFSRC